MQSSPNHQENTRVCTEDSHIESSTGAPGARYGMYLRSPTPGVSTKTIWEASTSIGVVSTVSPFRNSCSACQTYSKKIQRRRATSWGTRKAGDTRPRTSLHKQASKKKACAHVKQTLGAMSSMLTFQMDKYLKSI